MGAFASGWLTVQRCRVCGQLQHPSGPRCTGCGSADLDRHRCSGAGAIHALAGAVDANHRGPAASVPAIVELDEGLRITAAIVGCNPHEVRVGQRVEATSVPAMSMTTVVTFQPASRTPTGRRWGVGDAIDD